MKHKVLNNMENMNKSVEWTEVGNDSTKLFMWVRVIAQCLQQIHRSDRVMKKSYVKNWKTLKANLLKVTYFIALMKGQTKKVT